MKNLILFLVMIECAIVAQGPAAGRSVMVDPSTYSLLGSFTNFFKANSNLLVQAVSAGSITGAVQSVNGKVGTVVLDAASVGAQPLSTTLTAWSAVSPTTKQNTSANLTGWSGISPFTTNNFATIEYANRAMTNGFTPNAYFNGTSNRFSGALSVVGGLFGYGGLTIDEGLQKTLRVKSPASGYQGLYFGANATSPDLGNYGLIGDTYTTALNAPYGSSAEVSLRVGNLKVAWATNTSVLNVNGLWAVNEIKIAGQSIYESAGVLRLPHIYVEDLDFTTISGLVPSDQLTGTISPDKLGSGTPSSGTVLCGDGVWRVVAGASGDVLSVNGQIGEVVLGASDVGAQAESTNLTQWSGVGTNALWTDATNLTGTVNPARLGSGTADNTTILYGDNVWRTAPTGGTGGAVDSVNGKTGTVVLTFQDVGAQAGSANLTNWSALAPSSKQDTLGFVPQFGAANLTNWASLLTSDKQDALGFVPQFGSANLTNWSGLTTASKQDALGFIPQYGSANLTNWSAIATGAKQDSLGFIPQLGAANLTNWSAIQTNVLTNAIGVDRLPGWSSMTNAMTSVSVTMGASIQITNLSGDITFTGPVWQTTTNQESVLVDMAPSGGNRNVAVPASWRTSDGAGSWVLTNGNWGYVTVGGVQGRCTNAVFTQFWRN